MERGTLRSGERFAARNLAFYKSEKDLLNHHKRLLAEEPAVTTRATRIAGLNFGSLLQTTVRFRFEDNPEQNDPNTKFFWLDPMRIPQGSSVARHIGFLKTCFEAAFPMEAFMSLILEKGLTAYYTTKRQDGGAGYTNLLQRPESGFCALEGAVVIPSFQHFYNYFIHKFLETTVNKQSARQTDMLRDMQEVFRRRFENLKDGLVGKAFEEADRRVKLQHGTDEQETNGLRGLVACSLPWLMGIATTQKKAVPSVIELDGLVDDDHKALVMAFLLSFLYEHRQAQDATARKNGRQRNGELQHVLIVEEAHRLLANTNRTSGRGGDIVGESSKAKAVSMFVSMLAEIRALGQGIIIVEQIPTKIAADALKNTNLKIMLRLSSSEDRDYLGQAMGLSEAEKAFAQTLRAREGGFIEAIGYSDEMEDALQMVLPLPKRNPESANYLYDEFF